MTARTRLLKRLLLALAILPSAGPALVAQVKAEEFVPSDFIRFVEEGEHAGHLDSAIVTYRRGDGVAVHLVAALHVGEKSYYKKLSEAFETYDALLYEMVKPKDLPVEETGRSQSALSMFQRWLKDALDLEFQLDAIDYTRKNFIHADMDPDTFFALQKERGESIFTLMLRALQNDLARASRGEKTAQITIIDLIRIFTSKDRSRELKLVLGRQFEDIESQLAGFEGEKGSVILTERNKVAIKVLLETIERGKKTIGIFYGGGHMRDLEARLVKELGFKKVESRWLVAWDMTEKKGKPPRKVERF